MRLTDDLIAQYSMDHLADGPDNMVHQVWEDGEITLQKCGDLLWCRSLHSMKTKLDSAISIERFPHHRWGHGYIFSTKEGCEAVREAIELESKFKSLHA